MRRGGRACRVAGGQWARAFNYSRYENNTATWLLCAQYTRVHTCRRCVCVCIRKIFRHNLSRRNFSDVSPVTALHHGCSEHTVSSPPPIPHSLRIPRNLFFAADPITACSCTLYRYIRHVARMLTRRGPYASARGRKVRRVFTKALPRRLAVGTSDRPKRATGCNTPIGGVAADTHACLSLCDENFSNF